MKKISKYAIIDYRAKEETVNSLKNYFDKVIFTKPLNTYEAIKGHADISLCKINDNEIITCPSKYEYYKKELPGINVISGSSEPLYKYPDDIFYNVACFGNVAFHNFKFTDKITLAVIEQKFSKHINVHQGYSKCSICFVNSSAIITDDDGIYANSILNGIEALKVNKGNIILKNMNYGFFGGATGTFENKIFLNGSISSIENGEEIKEFINKHNKQLIELKEGPVEDIGSIICLSEKIYV